MCQDSDGGDNEEWYLHGKSDYYKAVYRATSADHTDCILRIHDNHVPPPKDMEWDARGILACAAFAGSLKTFNVLLDLGFEVGDDILGSLATRGRTEILRALLDRDTGVQLNTRDAELVDQPELMQRCFPDTLPVLSVFQRA